MESYLDNAATTKPFPEVVDTMVQAMEKFYGNPSSLHKKGVEAEECIKCAAATLARVLKVEPKEIIFTSGGTESNNMALIGSALAKKRSGKHIVTTELEHASVYQPLAFLEEQGFSITYLPVDSMGHVIEEKLVEAITKETILVSIMLVNNEIGVIEDVKRLCELAKKKNPNLLFHVDAIQAFGKMPIYPNRMGIDLLSISGHKIHGPKGIGVLYLKDSVKIKPILYGGSQQKNMRSGTENVPAIAGLSKAVEIVFQNLKESIEILYERKIQFITELLENIPDAVVIALDKEKDMKEAVREGAPHIVSVAFPKVRSEVLLHALEEKEIYVSSGSACSSNYKKTSNSLTAIGVPKELLDTTLRFSFCTLTSKEEIHDTICTLKEILPMLKKYQRR